MGGAGITHGKIRNSLVRKPNGKGSFLRPKHRC